MINKIRTSLAAVGGFQAVLAFAAIGWGLHKLEQIATERQEMLDLQQQVIAEQQATLADLAKQRHPANYDGEPVDVEADPLNGGEAV